LVLLDLPDKLGCTYYNVSNAQSKKHKEHEKTRKNIRNKVKAELHQILLCDVILGNQYFNARIRDRLRLIVMKRIRASENVVGSLAAEHEALEQKFKNDHQLEAEKLSSANIDEAQSQSTANSEHDQTNALNDIVHQTLQVTSPMTDKLMKTYDNRICTQEISSYAIILIKRSNIKD
jgi:hypothetical protein